MRVSLQPRFAVVVRHSLDAILGRFAIMSDRPGRSGARENKNERRYLTASSAQINRRDQAEQSDGQPVNG